MDSLKIFGGLIVIAVAIWMFFMIDNPIASYLGGAIVAIAGIFLLLRGFKKPALKEKRSIKPKKPGRK